MFLDYVSQHNGPFKAAMEKFTRHIVNMMKAERLYETQGGPIILYQIENEYGPLEYELGAPARAYTKWAAQMTAGLGTGVPWVMCKQDDAPDPIINTCNGFDCDSFSANKNFKPKMWNEAWTGWRFLTDQLKTWHIRLLSLFRQHTTPMCMRKLLRLQRHWRQMEANQCLSNHNLEGQIFRIT